MKTWTALVPPRKSPDMPTGWICGQTARDFIKQNRYRRFDERTGIGGVPKTSKFFCKTDFDMKEIKKEEAAYVPLPKFYTRLSRGRNGNAFFAGIS